MKVLLLLPVLCSPSWGRLGCPTGHRGCDSAATQARFTQPHIPRKPRFPPSRLSLRADQMFPTSSMISSRFSVSLPGAISRPTSPFFVREGVEVSALQREFG